MGWGVAMVKKLVNGKVVKIRNIKLFEKAAEGVVRQGYAKSSVKDGIDKEMTTTLVKDIIDLYDNFYASMPYPLYAIEDNIKYVTLANYIKHSLDEELNMWVNKGLYIKVDEKTGLTLYIVNNTWGFTYIKEKIKDNTDMGLYINEDGFDDFNWVLEKYKKGESTSDYYQEFMGEFVSACKGMPVILKWELENILNFGNIPKKQELKDNTIIDSDNGIEYTLDIYEDGYIESSEKVKTFNLHSGTSSTRNKRYKKYGYTVYKKEGLGKSEEGKMLGMDGLFLELWGIKEATDVGSFPIYKGVIGNSYIAFEINRRLFICKANRREKPIEIANNISIYSIDNGMVYFTKETAMYGGISKEILYSCRLTDKTIKMCRIAFRK